MKILIVSGYRLGVGGPGVAVLNWLKCLNTYSNDITHAYVTCYGCSESLLKSSRLTIYNVSPSSRLSQFVQLREAVNTILDEHNIDLIHVHSPYGVIFHNVRPKIPIVVTYHYGPIVHNNLFYALRYASLPENLRRWTYLYEHLIQQEEYKISRMVTCQTRDMISTYVSCYRFNPKKIYVLPLAVEVRSDGHHRSLASVLNRIGQGVKECAVISNANWLKGLPVLLRALKMLADRYGKEIKCVLVGGYYSNMLSLKSRERKLFKELVKSNNLIVVTSLKHDFFLRILPIFKAFVSPHSIPGLPLTSLEAGGVGVPSILANKSVRHIEISKSGFVYVNGDDEEALAQSIYLLCKDNAIRKILSERVQQYVLLNHSIENVSKILLSLYYKISSYDS